MYVFISVGCVYMRVSVHVCLYVCWCVCVCEHVCLWGMCVSVCSVNMCVSVWLDWPEVTQLICVFGLSPAQPTVLSKKPRPSSQTLADLPPDRQGKV